MRGKQRKAKFTQAWGSTFTMKNAPVERWPATRKEMGREVLLQHPPECRGQDTKALP